MGTALVSLEVKSTSAGPYVLWPACGSPVTAQLRPRKLAANDS